MLLKVNKNDKVIGYETKKRCHIGEGILHRAFTIFVLNKNKEVLIQKRSKDKFLWPLFLGDNMFFSSSKRREH